MLRCVYRGRRSAVVILSCGSRFAVAALAITFVLTACSSFGPSRVPSDNFNYNQAIADASKEQLLLNLLRLRNNDVPVFLTVSSVLTQYTFAGNAGLFGSLGTSLGEDANSITGSVGGRYAERPTISYTPLTGENYSRQLLAPIPTELFWALLQAGFPADKLLLIGLRDVNGIRNLPFNRPPSVEAAQNFEKFQRVIELFVELGQRGSVEMQTLQETPAAPKPKRFMVFQDNPETRDLVVELKGILGLDPERTVFRVTDRLLQRKPDEITVRSRSMLALMTFVAQTIDMPPPSPTATETAAVTRPRVSSSAFFLQVRSSAERPADAFVAVKYLGEWFYIERDDASTKETFSLLAYLFQLQSPEASTAAPILTVPAG